MTTQNLFDQTPEPGNCPLCNHATDRHKGGTCQYGNCLCGHGVTEPHAYLPRDADPTSVAAAKAVWPRSGTQRQLVMEALYHARAAGMTDDELLQVPGTGVKAGVRRQELVAMGYAIDSGKLRLTRSDCEAHVWVLTDESVERVAHEMSRGLWRE